MLKYYFKEEKILASKINELYISVGDARKLFRLFKTFIEIEKIM